MTIVIDKLYSMATMLGSINSLNRVKNVINLGNWVKRINYDNIVFRYIAICMLFHSGKAMLLFVFVKLYLWHFVQLN